MKFWLNIPLSDNFVGFKIEKMDERPVDTADVRLAFCLRFYPVQVHYQFDDQEIRKWLHALTNYCPRACIGEHAFGQDYWL